MEAVAAAGMDHVAYILILYSLALIVFLFTMMLIALYERCFATVAMPAKDIEDDGGPRRMMNGHGGVPMRDAQEFELAGLMSDDEDDDGGRRRTRDIDDERGLDSPSSTIGKNSEGVAR
jgi:hypothetical protein